MRNTRRNKQLAFTMVELIIVMTIMTLMGIFAAMAIHNVHDHAKIEESRATVRLIEIALDQYKQDIGHYPNGDGNTLPGLLTQSTGGWKGAGMHWFREREDLKDSWGMVIQYCSAFEYRISGRGAERVLGIGQFYNSRTHQIYSMGPNMKTWVAPTAWVASKAYAVGDFVFDGATATAKYVYRCKTAHTSSAANQPSSAGGTANWTLHTCLCGTEPDDIRNWQQETYYTSVAY